MGCSYGELAAAARCSLLQQQAVLLQRMLSTDAAKPKPPAAASAQQQQYSTAEKPAPPAAPMLNPLQPYIPPGLILPKVPGSSSAVRTAEFAAGAYSAAQLPPERWPEVAVVGRSNVGKSSLINCLLGSSSLAKVSKHPGGMPHAAAATDAAASQHAPAVIAACQQPSLEVSTTACWRHYVNRSVPSCSSCQATARTVGCTNGCMHALEL
jgi:hypothetical protein